MGILKYALVLTNLIIWGVQPVIAQSDNPCPTMGDYQVSFPEFDIQVYENPNINSKIIAEIPAGRRFYLSNIFPQYYDDYCWYQITTFSVDETGWIGFELMNNNGDKFLSQNQDNLLPSSLEPVAYPSPTSSIAIAQKPISQNKISRTSSEQKLFGLDLDFIIGIIIFIVIVIILTIIVAKIAIYLLYLFAPTPIKQKVHKRVIPQLNKTPEKSVSSVTNNNLKGGVINVTQTDTALPDQSEKISPDSAIEKDVYIHFLLNEINQIGGDAKTLDEIAVEEEEVTEDIPDTSGLSLEYYISNFNQGNKEFFEDETRLSYLKPTESAIHGMGGNLELGDRQEFAMVEKSQASYLAFNVDGEIYLIPNLTLSQWPRLLTSGTFFDVYPDLTTPKLVKPAKLTSIDDRRWQIIEKGSFN